MDSRQLCRHYRDTRQGFLKASGKYYVGKRIVPENISRRKYHEDST